MTVPLENVGCPLGCRDGDEPVVTGYDRLNRGPGTFDVVRCRGCGLMRTNPRPTAQGLGAYYPDDYAPYATSAIAPPAPPPRASALRRLLQNMVDSRSQWLPALPPGNMLEFGCAAGGFLVRMRAAGWQVEGVDISPEATARARAQGLAVHTGTLASLPSPARPYDLVVGWMALEHLPDPLDALRLLYARTRPDGWLVLSVPDAGALEFRIFGSRWYALQLPAHLFHFTPHTLGRLLSTAGWRIEAIHFQRTAGNLTGSFGHFLADLGFAGAGRWLVRATARSAILHRFLLPLAVGLGMLRQSGRMTVWARKSDA
ncbi:MAG: class I SAM-dependent methyltransferase [Betaproteobacteria bacterium]|nr:class I SAM-dependent methyltransferase [Betaproteobacteria bacterium]